MNLNLDQYGLKACFNWNGLYTLYLQITIPIHVIRINPDGIVTTLVYGQCIAKVIDHPGSYASRYAVCLRNTFFAIVLHWLDVTQTSKGVGQNNTAIALSGSI